MTTPATPSGNPPPIVPTKEELRNGIPLPTGTKHQVEVPASTNRSRGAATPSHTDAEFRAWPSLSGTLPTWIVDRISRNRDAVPILPKIGSSAGGNGYSYGGIDVSPSEICTDAEAANPRTKSILERLSLDLSGEGGVSSAMTGDKARFTWGHGLTGSVLAEAFTKFLGTSEAAKNEFLECGIAMEAKEWKIVDLGRGQSVSGAGALDLLDGKEPANIKKNFISIFGKITGDHALAAANAQWPTIKQKYFYSAPYHPPQSVIDQERSWSATAIAYVIHCGYWGTFAGWSEFVKTNGDLRKILRLEAEFMYPHNNGVHVLVKQDDTTISGGPVTPSTTMLFNMGHGAMASQDILQPLESLALAQTGDVVFEIHPSYRNRFNGAPHAVLRGVPRQYDPGEECSRWCEANHYLPMDYLLKACRERSTANKLRITRNWYDSGAAPGTTANPQYQRWGMRLRVAMDAVLHGKTKNQRIKDQILADARTAALPEVQLKLIKSEIGAH